MTYDVILFTDLAARFWHSKPLGAYRLATELRLHNYSVKVIDYTSLFFQDAKQLFLLLNALIGPNTIFIGFSASFFASYDKTTKHSDKINEIRNICNQVPHILPCSDFKFSLVCKQIKKSFPHVKLVFGGTNIHSKVVLNDSIDYIVLGLADKSIIDLANHLKFGTKIKFNFNSNGQKYKIIDHDIKGLSYNFVESYTRYQPEDHILPGEVLALETSRGCLFKCKFCAFPLLGRKKTDPAYHKHVSVLADELKRNWEEYRVNKYFFIDDTFNETTDKIQTVLQARDLAGVDLEFFSYLRIDLLEKYTEQIDLLRNLGLRSAFFGVETLNDASAKSIGKGLSSARVKETLFLCREKWQNETAIHTNFIAGLPHETPETLHKWMEWSINYSPADSMILNPLMIHVDNVVWPSEFTANYKQYNYQIENDKTWKNNVWSEHEVREICNTYTDNLYESKRLRLGNWEIMGLQNYGFSFYDLKNKPYKDLNLVELESKYLEIFNSYKSELLQYEKIL